MSHPGLVFIPWKSSRTMKTISKELATFYTCPIIYVGAHVSGPQENKLWGLYWDNLQIFKGCPLYVCFSNIQGSPRGMPRVCNIFQYLYVLDAQYLGVQYLNESIVKYIKAKFSSFWYDNQWMNEAYVVVQPNMVEDWVARGNICNCQTQPSCWVALYECKNAYQK